MEKHNKLIADYNEKRDNLQALLQKVHCYKEKSNPKELANELQKKCNELQVESDKMRKQFKKNEITMDQFVSHFIKTKAKLYEHESAKVKLQTLV